MRKELRILSKNVQFFYLVNDDALIVLMMIIIMMIINIMIVMIMIKIILIKNDEVCG